MSRIVEMVFFTESPKETKQPKGQSIHVHSCVDTSSI